MRGPSRARDRLRCCSPDTPLVLWKNQASPAGWACLSCMPLRLDISLQLSRRAALPYRPLAAENRCTKYQTVRAGGLSALRSTWLLVGQEATPELARAYL